MSPRSSELLARARQGLAAAQTLVDAGHSDGELARDAQRAQARREASDYAAETFELSEARRIVVSAQRFVAAVDRRLAS